MEKMREILAKATFEVFERMFFLFLEPVDALRFSVPLGVSIRFEGKGGGTVRLLLSRGVAETMVGNMLGVPEKDVTDRHMADCLKEAVNMIGGNFLRKWDPAVSYRLGLPKSLDPSELGALQAETERRDGILLCFETDQGAVAVSLNLGGESA